MTAPSPPPLPSTSPAHRCVFCGAEAVLAPRVHLRWNVPGVPARDVALGLCEIHGMRMRKGEVRVLAAIEAWLSHEGRFNPANPLEHVRLSPHCLACDAPLAAERLSLGRADEAPHAVRKLKTGEVVTECGSCPAINVLEQVAGEPVAVQLYQPGKTRQD